MFYVVRQGEPLENYHSAFTSFEQAVEYANQLKHTLGHQYNIIKAEAVWTTQTLADLRADGAF